MSVHDIGVLMTDGTNCYEETVNAFEAVGATAEVVHINELRSGERRLSDFGGLAIPGGFTYGDDIASGAVLACEMRSYLFDELLEFVDRDKPIIGICNGFQVLVRTGLLPGGSMSDQTVTLAENRSGRFECRWIDLEIGKNACKFVSPEDFPSQPIPMQIAHGEGRFVGDRDHVNELSNNGQIVFSYAPRIGSSYDKNKPYNPNGSMLDIAGICDESGLILGMMPHPERSVAGMHPNRARTDLAREAGITIFKNMAELVR